MQEITKKLIQKTCKDFEPVAESMAEGGASEDDIVRAFNNHIKIKQNHYYGESNQLKPIGEILGETLNGLKNKTSKAEWIFYQILKINKIDFKYQHKIGPYHADFLFKDSLVLEIDGPDHEKEKDEARDKYLKKMGYQTMRVPLTILFHSPQAVIEEIQDLTK